MGKKMFLIISLLITFCAFRGALAQTNYYVDNTNGNDLNNGTSLETAWKTIQKACNASTPNSIVQIKGGTYKENIVVNVSGTAANPITFKNYMNDIVFIDGTGTSGTTLLTIKDKAYLNFENLTIQNLTKNDAVGILVESSATASTPVSSLYFKKITVRNINWTSNKASIPGSNNNAQPFIAYGRGTTAGKAITTLVIDGCEFYNNIPGFSETMSLDGNIDGFTLRNNLVHDNRNIGIYAGGNYGECSIPALDHARNGIIENNTCYNNISLYATSGGIYADGAQNIVIQKNSSYGNGYGIEVGCEENGTTDNITVINNLLYKNTDAGISVGGYTTATTGQVLGCIFRNNTLFQNDDAQNGSGEFYITKASNCVFENNVVYTNNQEILMALDNISPQTGNVFNFNCWYTPSNNPANITVAWRSTSYNSFTAYKNGTSQDANSIYQNPNLTSPVLPTPNLYLLSSSPCINSGKPGTVNLSGETDYLGNPRIIDIIDIGAYEFNSTPTRIDDIVKNRTEISVYPNPFKSETIIYLKSKLNNGALTLYDITGNEVQEIKNILGEQIKVHRSNLKNGIYFYKITQYNKVLGTGKLIAE